MIKPFSPPFSKPFTKPFGLDAENGFSPLNIADLNFWFDSADLSTITIDVGVSNLADKSGNSLDLIDLSDTQQPDTGIDTINGKNVLTFNGATPAGDFLFRNAMPFTSSTTILWVGKVIGVSLSSDSIYSVDAGGDFQIDRGVGGEYRANFNDAGLGVGQVLSPTDLIGLDVIIIYILDAVGGTVELRINGSLVDSDNGYNGNLSASQNFKLGANRAGGEFIPMLFAEMLNYNRALTPTEIGQLETYLTTKWMSIVPPLPPLTVSGNVLWLDAAEDITTRVDGPDLRIEDWLDQGPEGNDADQIILAEQPIFEATGFDGLPGVKLVEADNHHMLVASSSSLDLADSFTTIAVLNTDSLLGINSNRQIISKNFNSGWRERIAGNETISAIVNDGGGFEQDTSTGAIVNGTKVILSLRYTVGGTVENRADGILLGVPPTNTLTGVQVSATPLFIGAANATSEFFSGFFAHILIYNRLLTDEELNLIGNYLADRYPSIPDWTDV